MVARRLLILMLVMLVITSLSSVFLAPPSPQEGSETAPTTTTSAGKAGEGDKSSRKGTGTGTGTGTGRLVEATLDASAPKPRTIRLSVGDQLALRVKARKAAQVEIPGLGQIDNALPSAPARFDLYADDPGRFTVRLLPAERKIGVLVVDEQRGTEGAGDERSRP